MQKFIIALLCLGFCCCGLAKPATDPGPEDSLQVTNISIPSGAELNAVGIVKLGTWNNATHGCIASFSQSFPAEPLNNGETIEFDSQSLVQQFGLRYNCLEMVLQPVDKSYPEVAFGFRMFANGLKYTSANPNEVTLTFVPVVSAK